MPRRSPLLLAAVLCILALGAAPRSAGMTFAPLDGGRAVLSGIRVLAMAMSPDGTIYAGGRDTHDARTPGQPNPLGLGSVFLVSHDHGAHWSARVTEEPPPGYVPHYPAWTDHTRWPPNFTVYQLVMDPHHPKTVYAAGGFPNGQGGRGALHLLLRSTDGGRTWSEPLVRRVHLTATPPLVTNIVVTSANRQALTFTRVESAPAFAVDPGDSRRLYLGTDWLGVLRSTDGGVSWQYNPLSPNVGTAVSEQIVIDPQKPRTLYVLVQDTTKAALFRSGDGGSTWRNVWRGGFASSLFTQGADLYVARVDGIYASADRGIHWRLVIDARSVPGSGTGTTAGSGGILIQTLHRSSVWFMVQVNNANERLTGLYAAGNTRSGWHLVTDGSRGHYGALAINDMEYGYTRVWLDDRTATRVVFTSSQVDGLYRWSMTL